MTPHLLMEPGLDGLGFTHRPLSSSFLWFIFRIQKGNPKKELLRDLWVEGRGFRVRVRRDSWQLEAACGSFTARLGIQTSPACSENKESAAGSFFPMKSPTSANYALGLGGVPVHG